jgi:hypothetical protein
MPKSPQTVSRFDCLGFLYEDLRWGYRSVNWNAPLEGGFYVFIVRV